MLTGAISYYSMTQVASTSENLHEEVLPSISILGQMKYSVSEIFSSAHEYVYIENDDDRKEELEFVKEELVKLPLLLENYLEATGASQSDIKVHELRERVSEFIFTTEAFVGTSFTGDEDRLLLYHRLLEEEKDNLIQIIDIEIGLEQQEMDKGLDQVRSIQNGALRLVAILSLFFLALASVIAYLVYRSIAIPIDKLKDAVIKIGNGLFDIEIPGARQKRVNSKRDEVQDLAIHIDRMKTELKEKDKMKQEFINIAAHELRTPIQPILGYSELAKKGLMSHEEATEGILSEARRLKQLAEDILDVSRIEGNSLLLNVERFNFKTLIEEIVREKAVTAGRKIAFNLSLGEIEELEINADRSRFTQVLQNIIGNAIKFTKEGTISIEAGISASQKTVQLIISDTGPGIPESILPKLFEKFSSKSVKRGTEHGTGLGLYISKGIVEAHGGFIAGYNNNSGGATFKIDLPITSEQSQSIKQTAQAL
jgi:signal transduction histidine kinase